MRSVVHAVILAVIGIAPAAIAQAQQPGADATIIAATAPGQGIAERVVRVTALVEAVDTTDRTVTLKGPSGDIVTIAVGPEVKNFDQIRVGDFVVVRYIDSLTLELKKGDKASGADALCAATGARSGAVQAGQGWRPCRSDLYRGSRDLRGASNRNVAM